MDGAQQGIGRRIVGTVAQGFLFGLGFFAAMAVGSTFFWTLSSFGPHSIDLPEDSGVLVPSTFSSTKFTAVEEIQPLDKLALSELEEHNQGDRSFIIGRITNTGDTRASNIHVEANLFDGDKFVDQCSNFLSGPLAAGQSRRFKISCGCANAPAAAHDSFQVEIRSGY